jgi:hypothetical protein
MNRNSQTLLPIPSSPEKGELTTRIYAVPMETGLARPGEGWDSSRVGFELSATRRSQRLCRWLVRLANRIHVRAV